MRQRRSRDKCSIRMVDRNPSFHTSQEQYCRPRVGSLSLDPKIFSTNAVCQCKSTMPPSTSRRNMLCYHHAGTRSQQHPPLSKRMTSTRDAYRAAVVVLVLATAARAFVLAPTRIAPGFSSTSGRHSLHHTPTTTWAVPASRRVSVRSGSRRNGGGSNIPSSCPLNSRPGTCFAGCTAPLISSAAQETVAAGAVARRSARTTMGMGIASSLLPGGGRKVCWGCVSYLRSTVTSGKLKRETTWSVVLQDLF